MHYRFHRPIIQPAGDNHPGLTNWSPPWQGVVDVEPHRVGPWYEAVRAFGAVLERPELRYDLPQQPGHVVVFNNRRILHARTAYDPSEGARHLKGTYVNLDEFYECCRRLLEPHQPQ